MTNKEQIEVIEKVKKRLNEERFGCYFLCPIFTNVLKLDCGICNSDEAIAEHIPLFTKENARQFADPEYPMTYCWWDGLDKGRRLAFLNWMLDELASDNELPEDNFIMGGF